MTISVVQSARFSGAFAGSFGANVTAGNTVFLVVGAIDNGTTPTTSVPTIGGSAVSGTTLLWTSAWAQDRDIDFGAAWMLPNCPGGSAAVSITVINGTANAYCGLIAYEVAGLGTTPLLDKSSSNVANSSTPSSGASGTITSTPEFILGGVTLNRGISAGPTGWTNLAVAAGSPALWASYQIATSPGSTYTYSGMTVNGSSQWTSGVATIAAGGTPIIGVGTGTPQLSINPVIGSQRRARARLGRASTLAAGITPLAVTPPPPPPPPQLGTQLGKQCYWIARTVPRSRARIGGISAPTMETTMPTLTGVITIHNTDGTVTVWNITGTAAP